MISSTKNKLWIFGDSYSAGAGCGPSESYYIATTPQKKWAEILADKFGYEMIMKARGGISTIEIIDSIISNLSYIKNGDCIIVGDSVPTRLIGVSQKKKFIDNLTRPLVTFNNDVLFEPEGVNKDIFYEYDIQPENLETYVDYVYSFVYKYMEDWETFYRNQILNIFKDLKQKRGIECYFWSCRIWNIEERYETITQDTKGKIRDEHWSWNGHIQMADYMSNRLHNKIFIDSSEWENTSWNFHNDREKYTKYNKSLL